MYVHALIVIVMMLIMQSSVLYDVLKCPECLNVSLRGHVFYFMFNNKKGALTEDVYYFVRWRLSYLHTRR